MPWLGATAPRHAIPAAPPHAFPRVLPRTLPMPASSPSPSPALLVKPHSLPRALCAESWRERLNMGEAEHGRGGTLAVLRGTSDVPPRTAEPRTAVLGGTSLSSPPTTTWTLWQKPQMAQKASAFTSCGASARARAARCIPLARTSLSLARAYHARGRLVRASREPRAASREPLSRSSRLFRSVVDTVAAGAGSMPARRDGRAVTLAAHASRAAAMSE